MLIEPRCVRHVSLDRVCRPTLRFPPQGPPRRVPLLQQYYQSATTSCRPSRRTSFPSFGGTSVLHSLCSLLGGRVCRQGLELVTRYLRPGFQRGNDRTSQVPGNPNCPFAHVPIRRRQDCLHQTVHSATAWPLVLQKQRLPRKVFRRSIAWLSDSLSTLRRTGYPARVLRRHRPLLMVDFLHVKKDRRALLAQPVDLFGRQNPSQN
jgi:hypothetical protein